MDIAKHELTQVTRPLHVLVPLIKDDLRQEKAAMEQARIPYMMAAGEKILEAKPTFKGRMEEFDGWLKRNFNLSISSARKYMDLVPDETINRARGGANPRDFPSLNAYHHAVGDKRYVPNKPRPQAWHEPVKEAIGKVDVGALKQAALEREKERALQRKLALALIDIGYKALASKLHPDKGGSKEAMSRLNRVRDILRDAVSS